MLAKVHNWRNKVSINEWKHFKNEQATNASSVG